MSRLETVQRDLLRGAGLHAGRAGDRLRPCIEPDRAIGLFEEGRAGVVGYADCERAAPLGIP